MNPDTPMPRRRLPFFLFCLLPAALSCHAADLYRWQDDQGNVHYTDRVPPEYVKKGYRVISEQGFTIQTIKSVDKTKVTTPASPPPVSAEQALDDRRLLMTYGNEDEIIAARKRKESDLQALIELSRETISLLEGQFRQLAKEAGDYEKQSKPVPKELLTRIADTREKINKYQAQLQQHQTDMKEVDKKFTDDLQRYRELKQIVEKAD
jgi:hypothetical protein